MLTWEFSHAQKAWETGVYVTWSSHNAKEDCIRVGASSKCFCGHLYSKHSITVPKKGKVKSVCETCACKEFRYIPRRPEEIGMHWLVRRKGFNINEWGAPCICKHAH